MPLPRSFRLSPLPRPPRRLVVVAAAVLVGAPLCAALVLSLVDWNRARPWINDKISAALGRPFAIRGELALTWQRQGRADADRTWRDYLPLPHLLARDVHLGNPAGMKAPAEMASVGQIAFAIEPLSLLRKTISVPVLRFADPTLLLQRDVDGRNNWTFQSRQPSAWTLDIRRVVLSKGSLHYIDSAGDIDVTGKIEDIDAAGKDGRYGVAWTVDGNWNDQPVRGSAQSGAVLALSEGAPFPLTAKLDVGGTRIGLNGTLSSTPSSTPSGTPTAAAGNGTPPGAAGKPSSPAAGTALDMRLQVSGPSMARLYGLTGVLLPETPPFSTEGRLRGSLGAGASHWVYDQFTGRVGSSDIAGRLDYQASAGLRPLLTGAVQSKLLQFSDLGPLIGADSNASKQARGVDNVQPGNRVLPAEPFKTARWTALNADVGYKAQRLTRDGGLPINNLDTLIHMREGVLSLKPMNFDIAGGRFTSQLTLDGSGKVNPRAIRAELKADARHLQLRQLFPRIDGMRSAIGEVNAEVALKANGDSVAALLGASNGEFKGVVDQGSVSKVMLEEIGLNIGSVVLANVLGDEQVKLNCLVTNFSVADGLMRSRLFVVDTADARIDVAGTVNLANEKMDLTARPQSKGVRLLSLRAPVYVRGTFKDPAVSVDKGVMAWRAGGALVLAAVAPVAALLPLVDPGQGGGNGCAALLAQSGQKASSGTKR